MTRTIALLLTAVLIQPAAAKAGPWKSLFDGKTMNAWRIFKTDNAPKMCDASGAKDCWEIANGVLRKDGHANDIASKEQFGDFELELEWKMATPATAACSTVAPTSSTGSSGAHPEYPLLDNVNAADNKKDNHLAGSVYDLYAPPKDAARPANEWNQTRIVAKGSHVEHWLNGKKVASYSVGTGDWDAAIKASKFNPGKYPNFGKAPKGYLGIQGDHPDWLELRNIRIRELS